MEEQKRDVGAIWARTSKKGNSFLSIKIGDVEYIAFKNDKGDNPKRPDWKIYPSQAQGEEKVPF